MTGHLQQEQTVVLLVDDQPIIGEAVRRLLAGEKDIEFHFCSTASAAVQTAVDLKPTVILQDLVMPDVEGLELVQSFRATAATAEVPIIVLSSREEAQTKSDAFAAGASDYLVKLPDRIELLARIRYHSKAYLVQLHRNAMSAALSESERKLEERVHELQVAFDELSRVRAQIEEANSRLERESFLDTLTEALNRRGIEHQLSLETGRAMREGGTVYGILLDCDSFKAVNDGYGHDAGDLVLREIAMRIAACVRRTDHVARVGGDEFLVILSQASADHAVALADRLRQTIADEPIGLTTSTVGQTVSVAVFEVPLGAQSTTDVLASGTMLLHESKDRGKNRVTVSWEVEVEAVAGR